MFILPPAGTRQNAAINSNRWAGRPPSQRIHRKDWIPPDVSEQRPNSNKILHYSQQDYVIGESSQGALQRIAHRLNNGPSPAQILPESDDSDIESEMAELSRQRSGAAELEFYPAPHELGGNSFAVELDAGSATYLTQHASRFQGETISSRLSEERRNGHSSGSFNESQDLETNTEQASLSASRQVRTADRKWEGGFF